MRVVHDPRPPREPAFGLFRSRYLKHVLVHQRTPTRYFCYLNVVNASSPTLSETQTASRPNQMLSLCPLDATTACLCRRYIEILRWLSVLFSFFSGITLSVPAGRWTTSQHKGPATRPALVGSGSIWVGQAPVCVSAPSSPSQRHIRGSCCARALAPPHNLTTLVLSFCDGPDPALIHTWKFISKPSSWRSWDCLQFPSHAAPMPRRPSLVPGHVPRTLVRHLYRHFHDDVPSRAHKHVAHT
ncbi:hypothetical protein B0H65DRAFT_90439 [Neurospora tetraspora]|uniref:Uncharacterized protein n=1 Tax=Neurospora tetraspora TaxID=94610 RepID=A0AAE0JJM6_9PEZI|nr:hypothetical protein B0H65DRAFT_90439 [Neurospora tetraspora]